MASVAAGEHRVLMPLPAASADGAPEKQLNRFVRVVALLERTGNALGTLAFTWATVILLGGYPTVLRPGDDFWFATTIVFLEAARMFSRNSNMSDYQLFFRTRGAFRSLGLGALVLVLCVSDLWAWWFTLGSPGFGIVSALLILMAILVIGPFLCPEAARLVICSPLRHGISLWSPMIAILLMAPSLRDRGSAFRLIYLVLLVVVLPLIISRLRFPGIIKLVDSALGRKLVSWRRVILNSSMFAALVIMVVIIFLQDGSMVVPFEVLLLVLMSFGNLQFPAAVLRVVLSLLRIIQHNYVNDIKDGNPGTVNLAPSNNGKDGDPGTVNLAPSISIFYWMVLGQGILYIVACILEAFSFCLRKSLIHSAGFRGHLGVEYINLYYAYAFDKCIGGAVFAHKKISLIMFAIDSLKLDSPKMQLYGVQMLHSFLKKEPFKNKTISKLTTSTETLALLFNMLGSTGEEYKYTRLLAAKVIAELAYTLRVSLIPGAMQLISSLLGTVHHPEVKDPLLDTDSEESKQDASIQQVSRDRQNSPMNKWWKQMVIYCFVPVEEPLSMNEYNSCIVRCCKQVSKCCSVPVEELPEEEISTDQDLLPVLGMSILDRLGSFGLENCIEISRATGLISKIIEFTSKESNMTNIIEEQQTLVKGLSLKVLRSLSSTKGTFGVTLRQKLSEHPFLLSNLAQILHACWSSQEHRELAAEILRNLAVVRNASAEIGHIQGIISSLMQAFLSRGAPSSKIAGQALAVLAMEAPNNCLVMLAEPGYVIIKELTNMIHSERFRCIAASLLWNMCMHAKSNLENDDLKDLSNILQEVLAIIMDTKGAELEIFVGLCSQLCKVIPEEFSRELEHCHIEEKFIKRLVNALDANIVPTSHCPGIRRVIVEQAIYMMQCNPSYTNYFNKCCMMDKLLMVEHTPSRAENYRFFLGDAGLMEHIIPLSRIVAQAKELIHREY